MGGYLHRVGVRVSGVGVRFGYLDGVEGHGEAGLSLDIAGSGSTGVAGSGSGELFFDAGGAEGAGYGSADLGLDASGSGTVEQLGYGSADLGLNIGTVVAYTVRTGDGAADLNVDVGPATAWFGVAGSGAVDLALDASSQVIAVGLSGSGSGDITLSTTTGFNLGIGGIDLDTPAGYLTVQGAGGADIALTASGSAILTLAETFSAFVLNTKSRGHAEYTGFQFNSLFELDGTVYGCASDGIRAMVGKTDTGSVIDTRVKSGVLTFETSGEKQVSEASLLMRTDGDVEVVVTHGEEGERPGYRVEYNGVNGLQSRRRKFAKGIEAVAWQFEVKNVSGSDCELMQMDLDIDGLPRK